MIVISKLQRSARQYLAESKGGKMGHKMGCRQHGMENGKARAKADPPPCRPAVAHTSQKRSQGQGKAGVACRPSLFFSLFSPLIPAAALVMMCVRFCGCAIPCFGGILEKGNPRPVSWLVNKIAIIKKKNTATSFLPGSGLNKCALAVERLAWVRFFQPVGV